MAREQLSDKQQQILEFIKRRILDKGYPPAVREICEAVNLRSTSSVHSHLETLERKGYIHRDPTKPRAIEIIDDDFNLARREIINIPVVGTVTAGEPILAVQNIEDYFQCFQIVSVTRIHSCYTSVAKYDQCWNFRW